MRLDDKLDLLQALHAKGEGTDALEAAPVEAGALGGIPHAPSAPTAVPYLFEAHSQATSPWVDKAAPGRRFNFIGAHSYMNAGGYLRDGVLIGRYCSIGRRVTIAAGAHDMGGLSTSPALARGASLPPRPAPATPGDAATPDVASPGPATKPRRGLTLIRSDVWIGDGAVIMPGLEVGVGAVVAANAVLTRDAIPYGVYGGVPARLLRRRFHDALCAALVTSTWWERPHESLKSLPLQDAAATLDALQALAEAPVADLPTFRLQEA